MQEKNLNEKLTRGIKKKISKCIIKNDGVIKKATYKLTHKEILNDALISIFSLLISPYYILVLMRVV